MPIPLSILIPTTLTISTYNQLYLALLPPTEPQCETDIHEDRQADTYTWTERQKKQFPKLTERLKD